MKKLLALTLMAITLTACGQKGPLYLPAGSSAVIDDTTASQNPNDY